MRVHPEAVAAAKARRPQQVPVDGALAQEANGGQAFVARNAVREGGAAGPAARPSRCQSPCIAPASSLYRGQCATHGKRAPWSLPFVGEKCFQYYVFFSVIKMKCWSVGGSLYLAVTAPAELGGCRADATPHWCKCRAHPLPPEVCSELDTVHAAEPWQACAGGAPVRQVIFLPPQKVIQPCGLRGGGGGPVSPRSLLIRGAGSLQGGAWGMFIKEQKEMSGVFCLFVLVFFFDTVPLWAPFIWDVKPRLWL